MEEQLLVSFENAPYFISLIAGIITFLSPCVLPLVPAYLSYITGMSVSELSNQKTSSSSRFRIIESSLLFIFGFSVIFIAIGSMMAGFIENIFVYKWIPWLAGGIVVIFGLHFIGIVKVKFLNYEKRLNVDIPDASKQAKGFLGKILKKLYPAILGVAFALGWTPCIGPIFASIISLSASDSSTGFSLIGIYTLGLAIPFFVSALLTDYFISFFNKFKHHLRKVEIFSGILLVMIGIMIITGDLGILSIYIMDIFGI